MKTYEEKLKWSIERLAKDLAFDCDEATSPANSCFDCDDYKRDMCGTGIALTVINDCIETTLNEVNRPVYLFKQFDGRIIRGMCPRCGSGIEFGNNCGYCGLIVEWEDA